MNQSVKIGTRTYAVVNVHGRQFVNARETWVYVDHDARQIRVSDTMPVDEQVCAVAEAVSAAWEDVSRLVPIVG